MKNINLSKRFTLKKELYWKLQKNGISVYTYNSDLQKRIYTKNPDNMFSIMKQLCKPRTILELYQLLPNIPRDFINEVVQFLEDKNYLYSEIDIDPKYIRLQHFVSTIPNTTFENYEDKLNNIRILILGVGTGGSFQIEVLKRLGIKTYTLVDKDKVESKNLAAQNYKEKDIGKYKVDILKRETSDSSTQITIFKTYIKSYNELTKLLNINNYDYIIDTMDDKEVNLQILSRIFLDYPSVKLILNGYLVQKQMSYMVTKENYISFLKEVNDQFATMNPSEEIVDNSGSIFNALFMSLSVGKMIFDDLFEVRKTDYAYADFFMNDFFIGNHWEYNLYHPFSATKKSLNSASSPSVKPKDEWTLPITDNTYLQDTVLKKPFLNKIEKNYCSQKDDLSSLILAQKMYNSIRNISTSDDTSFTQVRSHLLSFIKNNFGTDYEQPLDDLYCKNRIFTQKGRFDKIANLTLFNSGRPLIYSTEETSSARKVNLLIHEAFHALVYSNTFDPYIHEKLVLQYLTLFLLSNIDNPSFYSLSLSHLQSTLALYMNSFVSTQYEKKLLNKQIKSFQSLPVIATVPQQEILGILDKDINIQKPFRCLKYVYATDCNLKNIQTLYNHITS